MGFRDWWKGAVRNGARFGAGITPDASAAPADAVTDEAPPVQEDAWTDPYGGWKEPELSEADRDRILRDTMGGLLEEQEKRVMSGLGSANEHDAAEMLEQCVPGLDPAERDALGRAVRRYGEYVASTRLEDRMKPGSAFFHEFWTTSLSKLFLPDHVEDADRFANPAVPFTYWAKRGRFDDMDDGEYHAVLDAIERLSELWGGEPFMTRSSFVTKVMQRVGIPYQGLRDAAWGMVPVSLAFGAKPPAEPKARRKAYDQDADRSDMPGREGSVYVETPERIYRALDAGMQGQEEAKKAAAMVMYHHLNGRRENLVVAGPSGCGKSEMWRLLARRYSGHVRIVDMSRMAADGWRGTMHVEDIFNEISEEDLARQGLVVVLDEADKIVCETVVSGNGTDHGGMVQSNLLKIMDGDVVDFNNEDRRDRRSFKADCSKVSVVMLGTFEKLLENKAAERKGMGFGSELKQGSKGDPYAGEITQEDLIKAGMRREIAGRVDKIAMARSLDKADYMAILDDFVLPGLSGQLGRGIDMSDCCKAELIDRAVDSKLGVRWMRSRVLEAMDARIFEDPERKDWEIGSMEL